MISSVIIHPAPTNVPVPPAIPSKEIAVTPLMVSSVCMFAFQNVVTWRRNVSGLFVPLFYR